MERLSFTFSILLSVLLPDDNFTTSISLLNDNKNSTLQVRAQVECQRRIREKNVQLE